MAFDAAGRLWVVDRGNHRLEIFDQEGNYLGSRYMYGRISGIFIKNELVYAIDSESSPTTHANWRNGIRIGPVDEDRITASAWSSGDTGLVASAMWGMAVIG